MALPCLTMSNPSLGTGTGVTILPSKEERIPLQFVEYQFNPKVGNGARDVFRPRLLLGRGSKPNPEEHSQ